MKAEVSIELESEDLKDKKLAAFVMKLLARQAKQKEMMSDEMPEDEED